jgi:hypothetical protein
MFMSTELLTRNVSATGVLWWENQKRDQKMPIGNRSLILCSTEYRWTNKIKILEEMYFKEKRVFITEYFNNAKYLKRGVSIQQ